MRAFVVGFAVAVSLPSIAKSQTAMFRGGPDHRGVYDSPAPRLESLVWKFKTGGRVISSPVIVGDVIYIGSTDGSLYAVNRADGTQRWKFDTRGPIASSPAFHDGLVYVSSADGLVYAVEAASGTSRWTFVTKGERRFTAPGIHGAIPRAERMPDPFDVFLSSPMIANGTVFIGSGDQNVLRARCSDWRAALDLCDRRCRACIAGPRGWRRIHRELGSKSLCARCDHRARAVAIHDGK